MRTIDRNSYANIDFGAPDYWQGYEFVNNANNAKFVFIKGIFAFFAFFALFADLIIKNCWWFVQADSPDFPVLFFV